MTPPRAWRAPADADDSKRQRDALSLRSAPSGSRVVTFQKPNSATKGLLLGLKFKDSFGKNVIIDKILPGTEAARLESQGKIKVGDEITMVSATFGDDMWSVRGVGKMRLEKSIAVRQGMNIKFCVESPGSGQADRKKALKAQQERAKKMSRLQDQLTKEVKEEKASRKWGIF